MVLRSCTHSGTKPCRARIRLSASSVRSTNSEWPSLSYGSGRPAPRRFANSPRCIASCTRSSTTRSIDELRAADITHFITFHVRHVSMSCRPGANEARQVVRRVDGRQFARVAPISAQAVLENGIGRALQSMPLELTRSLTL